MRVVKTAPGYGAAPHFAALRARDGSNGGTDADSAVLGLTWMRRHSCSVGRSFAVRGVPAKLAALAKLYGVDKLLLKAEGAPPGGALDQRRPAT